MINVKQSGDFGNIEKLLDQIKKVVETDFALNLDRYGKAGVAAERLPNRGITKLHRVKTVLR